VQVFARGELAFDAPTDRDLVGDHLAHDRATGTSSLPSIRPST
jgi:hypothetical protein